MSLTIVSPKGFSRRAALLIMSISSAVFCLKADNQIIYGYDVLGAAMYCDTYLQAPKRPAVSTLLNTFGDPLPCIEKAIQQGVKHVQVDLIDATCWRNNVCPPGVPHPTNLRAIERRATRVSKLAGNYPGVEFWVSPALEHDVKDPVTVNKMCAAAIKGCPKCKCINSPFTGARPKDIKLELHGNNVQAFSVSNDGASIFDSNSVKYRLNGDRFVFAWFPEMNLRFTGEKTFTPPKLRKCQPKPELFEQANLLLNKPEEKAKFPSVCVKNRDLIERELVKTNAESYCNDDPRGNKMLFITKLKKDRLEIIDKQGKNIGCLKYYGKYTEAGYNRFYIGTCSKQNPVELYKQAKGEWAFIKNGEQCIRFNTIRRLGYYR